MNRLVGNRITRVALSVLIFSSKAIATSDYAAALKQIDENRRKIDQGLSSFGISSLPARSESQDSSEQTKLFVTHDSLKVLHASAGKLVFGKTYTRIVLSSEASPLVATLSDGQGVFSNLRILGKARASSTSGRVQIEFDRLVLRSGRSIPIKGMALDPAGALGLEAEVFSSKALAIVGAIGSSFISGVAASQQTLTPNAFGFQQPQVSGRNAILQGVAQTSADQAKRLIDESTQEKPVLVVEGETPLTLYLDEEVRF